MKKFLPLLLLAFPLTSSAVIIAGQNGADPNNTTQASLNSFISANLLPAFPHWGNIVQVQDASGIYLGSNGPYGFVLTAAHIDNDAPPLGIAPNAGSITVNGTSYTVRTNQQIGGADLRLYRIGGELGDPALPALANVPMSAATPGIGTDFLFFWAW